MDVERVRLVLLGEAGTGKSSIVRRFLTKSYNDKYKPTVEDLHTREFDIGPNLTLKVDILDTSGNLQFPAMRRIAVATANGFLLVYSTTSAPSFNTVKQCFEEIREQRSDYQTIPMIIVGNKSDLSQTHKEVRIEDVSEWVYCELPKLRVKVMEASAKDNYNINEIFKNLLSLSKILPSSSEANNDFAISRRSSAYVSATSKGKARAASGERFLATSSTDDTSSDNKSKPRSRSLIRRSSRKTKQQIVNSTADDCSVQ